MKNLILMAFALLMSAPVHAAPYAKDYFGETVIHRSVFEDTLIHLARENALGFVELRAANPTLDPWIPGAGVDIILPKRHILPEAPHKGIVVNLAEMRLYFFKDEGQPPITYPISIGREGLQTPTGTTSIVRKKDGPSWRPTARMREEKPELPEVVLPGPDNPLGDYAMYLGWPEYLMHGTNKPYGVGRRVSSGCMRMYPESIKALFPLVPIGTQVTVVDQAVKVGWVDDKMYVEVSPNQEQSLTIEEEGEVKSYEITAEDMKRINKKAGIHADKINWNIVRTAVQEHRGYPVEVLDSKSSKTYAQSQESVKPVAKAEIIEAKKEAEKIAENVEPIPSNKIKKTYNFNQ